MSSRIPPEADLLLPEPGPGEEWPTHTIHTHYHGFSIPEQKIGAFIYIRAQPYFKVCLAGVSIFKGMDNLRPLDCEHTNIVNTLPWPKVTGNKIETANGLMIDFLEPGHKCRITYRSKDGTTHFDVLQTSLCPTLPRGFVMPGEDRDADQKQNPTGLEQLMHCTGNLTLNGQHFKVNCNAARDRSISQVRTEDEVVFPPIGWSPIAFGPDFCFNQVGIEDPSTNPGWAGVFDLPKDKPSHHFAWLVRGPDDVRNIVRVKRNVLEYHPDLWSAVKQELEFEDDKGEVYRLKGEALAVAQLPSWPNGMFVDSVTRWTDEQGRVTHCSYQEAWAAAYWRFRRGRIS